MVSFTCDRCQDVIKKPKTISHAQSCGTQYYSCVDCMEGFDLNAVKQHNSCVSEADKYQGKWKQQTNNYRPSGKHGMIVDSDNEDEEAKLEKEKALLQMRVRPSAKNFLASDSDSSSDGEDWLKGGGAASSSSTKKASTRMEGRKRARSPDSDGEDDAVEKRKTAKASPKRNEKTKQEVNGAKKTSKSEEADAQNEKRHTPLLLPQSTAALEEGQRRGDITVASFTLGPKAEVIDIVKNILENHKKHSMKEKEVAKELVDCYRNRLAKYLKYAVAAAVAVSEGELEMDDEGNISCQ